MTNGNEPLLRLGPSMLPAPVVISGVLLASLREARRRLWERGEV